LLERLSDEVRRREKLVELGEISFLAGGACTLRVRGGTIVEAPELSREEMDEVDFLVGSGLPALSEDPDWNPLVTVLLGLIKCKGFSLGIKSSSKTEFESPSFDKKSSSFPLSVDSPLSSLLSPPTLIEVGPCT
jgi:hypothetical protein